MNSEFALEPHWASPFSGTEHPEEEKNKGFEKIFEEIIAENFPKMENEIVNQIQEAHSPIQHKPKEKHAKTHTNQTNKD